jgi:hypothetical protein
MLSVHQRRRAPAVDPLDTARAEDPVALDGGVFLGHHGATHLVRQLFLYHASLPFAAAPRRHEHHDHEGKEDD